MYYLEDIFDEELGAAPKKKAVKRAAPPKKAKAAPVKRAPPPKKAKAAPVRRAPPPKKAKAAPVRRAPPPKKAKAAPVRRAPPPKKVKPAPVKRTAPPKKTKAPPKKSKSAPVKRAAPPRKAAPSPFFAPTQALSKSILDIPTPILDTANIIAPAPEMIPVAYPSEPTEPEEQTDESEENDSEESEEDSGDSDVSPEDSEDSDSDDEDAPKSEEDEAASALEDIVLPAPDMKVSASQVPNELKKRILSLAKRADALATSSISEIQPKDQRSKFKLQIFSKLKDLTSGMPITSPTRMRVNKRIIMACKPLQCKGG